MLLGSRSMPATLVLSRTSSAVTSPLHEQVVDGAVELVRVDAEPDRQRALRVEVDQQHPAAVLGQRGAQVDRGRGLADAALLVAHGDDRGPGRARSRRLGLGDRPAHACRGRSAGPRSAPRSTARSASRTAGPRVAAPPRGVRARHRPAAARRTLARRRRGRRHSPTVPLTGDSCAQLDGPGLGSATSSAELAHRPVSRARAGARSRRPRAAGRR